MHILYPLYNIKSLLNRDKVVPLDKSPSAPMLRDGTSKHYSTQGSGSKRTSAKTYDSDNYNFRGTTDSHDDFEDADDDDLDEDDEDYYDEDYYDEGDEYDEDAGSDDEGRYMNDNEDDEDYEDDNDSAESKNSNEKEGNATVAAVGTTAAAPASPTLDRQPFASK